MLLRKLINSCTKGSTTDKAFIKRENGGGGRRNQHMGMVSTEIMLLSKNIRIVCSPWQIKPRSQNSYVLKWETAECLKEKIGYRTKCAPKHFLAHLLNPSILICELWKGFERFFLYDWHTGAHLPAVSITSGPMRSENTEWKIPEISNS